MTNVLISSMSSVVWHRMLPVALAFSLFPSGTAVAQDFNKLTACDDMTILRKAVERNPARCGRALTSLGRAIEGKLRTRACFFEPTQAALADFECAQPLDHPQITCFRAAPHDIVRRIKSAFSNGYDRDTERYVSAASHCSYASGRASPAPTSIIDFSVLGWIAKAELAWAAETGTASAPDGAVVHGFGSTDPEADGLPSAMEFVHVYGVRCRTTECRRFRQDDSDDVEEVDRREGLLLLREKKDQTSREMNRLTRRAGLPIRYEVASFRLEQEPLKSVGSLEDVAAWRQMMEQMPDRQAAAAGRIEAAVYSKLINEGFRRPKRSELGEATELFYKLRRGTLIDLPYARRDQLSSPRFELLVKDEGEDCFSRGGAMLFLFGSSGTDFTLLAGGLAGCRGHAAELLSRISRNLSLEED